MTPHLPLFSRWALMSPSFYERVTALAKAGDQVRTGIRNL